MKQKSINITILRIGFISILAWMFFLPQNHVEAAEDTTNVLGFTYKIEYPENQNGTDKGFFDLTMTSGQTQKVNLVLTNAGKDKVTVNVSLNGTKTNSNGVIEYGQTKLINDDSLKFPFEDVVSGPESVEILGGESKNVELMIKTPETSFDGMILGGITLKKANQEENVEKSKGATVRNEYSYVVAMALKLTEQEVAPVIKFNKAFATQENYRNTIGVNFSNITASLVSGEMSVESQIMKKGSDKVLFERKQAGMSIAPNSQMNFPIPMNGERMVAGDYTAAVLVSIGDQKWEDTLDFNVSVEEADKYNKRDVGLVQDRGVDWKIIALIVGGALAMIVVIYIIVKGMSNKKKKELKVTNKKSSRKSSGKSGSGRKRE